jgi:hypothetical protein
MRPRRVKEPADIRDTILKELQRVNKTRYRFAVECVAAGICQHHTVDELLASNDSKRSPSLPKAIALLDAAGLELVIRSKERKQRHED